MNSIGLIFTRTYLSMLLITTLDYDSVASKSQPLGTSLTTKCEKLVASEKKTENQANSNQSS